MKNFTFWIRLCVFNFFVVSVLGTIMRMNLASSFVPFLDVKLPFEIFHRYFQWAHSHFAFYGWVSSCLYALVLNELRQQYSDLSDKKYYILMIINQISAYGMLFSFINGGYYWLSIVFSTIALVVGFFFFDFLMKDTSRNLSPAFMWFRSGAFFATFSAIGIFGLAFIMAKKMKTTHADWYRAATYFYMHFQYNGFFFFTCIGLLISSLKRKGIDIAQKLNDKVIHLLFIGVLLGYGLCILWMSQFPMGIKLFFANVGVLQFVGITLFLNFIRKNWQKYTIDRSFVYKFVLIISLFAFWLKIFLQILPVIPALTSYAYNNISVVIGFLHLVLLMGISVFLIWKILEIGIFRSSNILVFSVFALVGGIVLNEAILAILGFADIFSFSFPNSENWILLITYIMMLSIFSIWINIKIKK